MLVTLKYGRGQLETIIPEDKIGGWILPKPAAKSDLGQEEIVREALRSPVGTPRLRELVRPGLKVAIVTSDITRPCPSAILLPPLLEELEAGGVRDSDIVVILALGIHRGHADQEVERLVGAEVKKRYRVVDHDPSRCRKLGVTTRGTPVDIFAEAVDADFRIALGNVEYHYFAGYSGGVKAFLPGISSAQAIRNNHSFMVHPDARAGNLVANPVRDDIEELTEHLGVDFILNVVLDEAKVVKAAAAGHHREAHRKACGILDVLFQVGLPAPGADVVLVSAGGFPKDINIYQAQKALDNAAKAVRPGGAVVWVGACDEGFGEAVFERWLNEAGSPADLVSRV
jgi:nickel-dependent lactate racemase